MARTPIRKADMSRAAIYARVSDKSQDIGYSIETKNSDTRGRWEWESVDL